MLAEITIKDFALIAELDLTFKPGLNVVTGETGAGKSIIIEAINLLVGGRADTSRVRRGAEGADIAGLFALDDGREFALRRYLSKDGKSRSFINGQPATTGQLSEVGASLLDIHGQHEHQTLLKAQNHLELIDRSGGGAVRAAKDAYQAVLADYRRRSSDLADLTAAEATRRDRLQLLTWQIQELSQAGLTPGEDEDLQADVERMKNFASLFAAADKSRRLLDESAVDALQTALGEVGRAAEIDDALRPAFELLGSAEAEIEEANRLLRDYSSELNFDEGQLQAAQERLFALSDLKKKYGLSLDGLVDYLESSEAQLDELKAADTAVTALTRAVAVLSEELGEAGAKLSRARKDAGERFVEQVRSHLRELAMAGAEFTFRLIPRAEGEWPDSGRESAEFLFSANAGEAPRPLARIASGGEVSRVMLAARTVFSVSDATPTLVFDEIDAGIGGRTAVKVGERLSELGRRHQVISVTHLAQIAAFADHHLAVAKSEVAGKTSMSVRPVSGAERLNELSRLGGALKESDVTMEHARQLLSQAKAKKSAVAAGE